MHTYQLQWKCTYPIISWHDFYYIKFPFTKLSHLPNFTLSRAVFHSYGIGTEENPSNSIDGTSENWSININVTCACGRPQPLFCFQWQTTFNEEFYVVFYNNSRSSDAKIKLRDGFYFYPIFYRTAVSSGIWGQVGQGGPRIFFAFILKVHFFLLSWSLHISSKTTQVRLVKKNMICAWRTKECSKNGNLPKNWCFS